MGKKNTVWNDFISKNERFADFINGVVFHGEQMVRPEALAALDTKLRRRERGRDSYHEFMRDMVKVWEYQGKKERKMNFSLRKFVRICPNFFMHKRRVRIKESMSLVWNRRNRRTLPCRLST